MLLFTLQSMQLAGNGSQGDKNYVSLIINNEKARKRRNIF